LQESLITIALASQRTQFKGFKTKSELSKDTNYLSAR